MTSAVLGIVSFIGSVAGIIGLFTHVPALLILGGCLVLVQCGYEVFRKAQNGFIVEIIFAAIGFAISKFAGFNWLNGIFLGLCLDGIIIGGMGLIQDLLTVSGFINSLKNR